MHLNLKIELMQWQVHRVREVRSTTRKISLDWENGTWRIRQKCTPSSCFSNVPCFFNSLPLFFQDQRVRFDILVIFMNTYFVEDYSKTASENMSFQLARSKCICQKVGNFEHLIFPDCSQKRIDRVSHINKGDFLWI